MMQKKKKRVTEIQVLTKNFTSYKIGHDVFKKKKVTQLFKPINH